MDQCLNSSTTSSDYLCCCLFIPRPVAFRLALESLIRFIATSTTHEEAVSFASSINLLIAIVALKALLRS